MAGDIGSMMHDNQVHIDADVIRGMIIDQFPEYRHERIEQLETTGTVNAIFRIGSGVAARFPLRTMKPVECADMLRSEAASHDRVREAFAVCDSSTVGTWSTRGALSDALGGAELDRRRCCYAKRTCDVHDVCTRRCSLDRVIACSGHAWSPLRWTREGRQPS